MVTTITPAGCGSRRRHRTALLAFATGAVGAAAALGALLGLAGAALGTGWLTVAAVALAVLAAACEARLLRVPVPSLRRQVPESWRRRLPLPVWSAGYGAGLGLGLLTHQPVATLWAACVAAAALGDPLAGAACLACFGVGRSLMVAWPARGGRDPGRAVERLVSRRGVLGPVNAAVLVALAIALAVQ